LPLEEPRATDIAYTENIYQIHMKSPLQSALDMMASKRNIYRLTVVDYKKHVRGVISGTRVLDIIAGRRGIGIKKRLGKNFEAFLRQPVRLFINEYLHKLSHQIPLKGIVSYVAENNIGHIILVDQMNRLYGVITERCIIDHLPLRSYGLTISDIMTTNVHSISSSQTLLDASSVMSSHNIRRLPVFEEKQLCGMITVTDILKYLISFERHIDAILTKEEMKKFMQDPIKSLDLKEPIVLNSKSEFEEFLKIMRKSRTGGFPVIDEDGKMIGIVSSRDVVVKLPKLLELQTFMELIN
jgi:CBS domain-containing membrane protein